MEDGTALSKLLEMIIVNQKESDCQNRELMERIYREKSTVTHSFDGIDLTADKHMTYPKMSEGESMTTYLAKLEYSFALNKTKEAKKCSVLWSHLTPTACDKLMATGPELTDTYTQLKDRLLCEYQVGYATAAGEALKPIDPEISMRDTLKKKDEMLAIVTEKARTIPQAISCVSRMIVRSQLADSLVYELDTQTPEDHQSFHRKCMEWRERQVPGTSMVRITRKEPAGPNKTTDKFKCFTCGKPGHTSKYCRQTRTVQTSPEAQDRKPIVCYNCREVGHKAPACPKPKNERPRKKEVKVLSEKQPEVKELHDNEILVKVQGTDIPVMLDSGATITVLPKEMVPETWLTGRKIAGKGFGTDHDVNIEEAHLSLQVAGKQLSTMGGVVPAEQINGIGVLSYRSTTGNREISFPKLLQDAPDRTDDDRLYLDYTSTTKDVQGAVKDNMHDSEGEAQVEVEKEEEFDLPCLGIRKEGSLVVQEEGSSEEESDGGNVQLQQQASVSTGEQTGNQGMMDNDTRPDKQMVDTDDTGVQVESATSCVNTACDSSDETLNITIPKYSEENRKLRDHIMSDSTLKHMKELADNKLQGYHWQDGLIIRERLDDLGRVKRQICLPQVQRQQVMTLAHDKFGHLSRNPVVTHIAKSFYWPTMWRDVKTHIQSCDTCQRTTKANPKRAPMISREIVTVPFERVSIDLVGPLPKSKGGFKYLFTYIDNSSRWPEAEPLRTITASSVVKAFERICYRNGFPRTVISDNGTQFCSSEFQRFCKRHNIQSIKCSPYRPQSNGLVERMHRTLTGMINKLSRNKQGLWNEITTLALYFMRMTPSSVTGFSPYMIVHGWEPASPLEVVKEGLLQHKLEDMDIMTWVTENMERIDTIADNIVGKQVGIATQRKDKRDKQSKSREFLPGTQVLYRTPGMNAKLTDSWEGPYLIDKKLGPVTYSITVEGNKRKKIAHINTLKEYKDSIRKITTILEEDKQDDDIMDTNDKLKLIAGDTEENRKADIEELQQEFSDTLREEPGTTDRAVFKINTGDAQPIQQRPYMTANSLKQGVEDEIQWLLDRGYIEESTAEWSSPIVIVRKPNGKIRICVDFRKVNAVTMPVPFYMPRIEEVLEATGQAKVISKMDLSKGYYQVMVCPEDRDKTTFVCHKGKFRFTRMPFGVCNAPAVFQTLMDGVVRGLDSFCRVYMDDLVIYSNSWTEHMTHVRQVLQALKNAGLTANPNKCEWGGKQLQFLGHIIGSGEMSIPKARIQALQSYVKPTTKRGLRSFLGAISFYRKFAKDLAKYTARLTPATSKSAPPKVIWTDSMDDAFQSIRKLMCSCTKLVVPLPSDNFSILTDASGVGIGGVLQVLRDEEWVAAAYYSRQTKGSETRYSATELEALALVETIVHFSYYLYGHTFVAFTDHHALLSLKRSDRLNGRLKRLALKLQPWDVDVQYLPGKENLLADALSRQEWRHSERDGLSSGAGGLQDTDGDGGEEDVHGQETLQTGEEAAKPLLGAGGCGGPASTED